MHVSGDKACNTYVSARAWVSAVVNETWLHACVHLTWSLRAASHVSRLHIFVNGRADVNSNNKISSTLFA